MLIKRVYYTDLSGIVDEYIRYFNDYESSDWNREKVHRKFKQLTERYDYLGLGLYEGTVLIGFAVGALSQFDDGLIALLNEIFIIKSKQSKGYGTYLLKSFEKEMKKLGAFRIQLESADDDVHNKFYNKMNGFLDAKNNTLKTKSL